MLVGSRLHRSRLEMKGRAGIAPCGCPGEYIIGQYIQCSRGCDKGNFDFCARCDSGDIDVHYSLDPEYLIYNPHVARFNRRCYTCGHLWVH